MTKVKICGITNLDDAMKAAYHGAWAVGFIFYKKSPRNVSPSKAKKIVQNLPPFVTPVGVFVNIKEKAIKDICRFTGIGTVQLHGDEDPGFCSRLKEYKVIKAFRLGDDFRFSMVARYKVDAYLFDAFKEGEYGGTGETVDWKFLGMQKLDRPVILSGGLNTANVLQAIETVRPYAVDVSSGVERSPGSKDPRFIRTFMDMVNTSQLVK